MRKRGAKGSRWKARTCLVCSRLEESIDRRGRAYWWCRFAGRMTYSQAASRGACAMFEPSEGDAATARRRPARARERAA